MLEINDLNIKIDDRYLVKNLSFTLNYGDKLAIIGEEGNGKSTLLKAILGNCEYANIEGSINLHNNRIGYLEQVINNKYLSYGVKNQLLHAYCLKFPKNDDPRFEDMSELILKCEEPPVFHKLLFKNN